MKLLDDKPIVKEAKKITEEHIISLLNQNEVCFQKNSRLFNINLKFETGTLVKAIIQGKEKNWPIRLPKIIDGNTEKHKLEVNLSKLKNLLSENDIYLAGRKDLIANKSFIPQELTETYSYQWFKKEEEKQRKWGSRFM